MWDKGNDSRRATNERFVVLGKQVNKIIFPLPLPSLFSMEIA